MSISHQTIREELIVLLLEPLASLALVALKRLLLRVFFCHVLVMIKAAQQYVLVVHVGSLHTLLGVLAEWYVQIQAVMLLLLLVGSHLGSCCVRRLSLLVARRREQGLHRRLLRLGQVIVDSAVGDC